MRARRPVQVRMAAAALALLVAIVAVLGTWQVMAARSSQRAEIEDGETNAAHLASSALASALASRLELLSNLAGNVQLAQIFTTETRAQLAKVAAALHQLYPGFAGFDIISANGRLDARWPGDPAAIGKDTSQGFFSHVMATGKPYVSQGLQQSAPPRQLVVVVVAPVRNGTGHIVGLLAASIPASGLDQLIGSTTLRDKASLVVFDQLGHVLTGPAAGASRSFFSVPSVGRALAGHTGALTGTVPGYQGSRLVGFAPVAPTGWAVVVEQPASQLNSQIAALTERLAAIGVVVLLLALGTVLLVASLLRSLGRERQRAGAVMASVGEGVATIDPDGVVQLTNPAMEHLTGRSGAELVGRPFSEAVRLYDRSGDPVPWDESIAAQAARETRVLFTSGFDLHLGRPDGQRVPVAMTAAPLVAGDELLGTVVVLRDVSREREVDQLKSSLVSTVSHELRTPLTMVQGFAELLLSREDLGPERSQQALGQILTSAQRLGRLIDDLLSVSRIDSGKLRVDLAAVDVAEVVNEAVRVASSHAPGSAERLQVEIAEDVPAVLADRDKLVQVLLNLVSNALKYSAAPAPVRVVALKMHDHAEISVIDRGIGMTELECSQVFEKFTRADRPEVRQVGGTGLGLYITKNLVEMQHGQVWVKSQPGQGSVFSLSVPLLPHPLGSDNALAAPGKEGQ